MALQQTSHVEARQLSSQYHHSLFFQASGSSPLVKFPGMMEINCLGIHRFITSCFYHDISIFIRSYGFYYKEFI